MSAHYDFSYNSAISCAAVKTVPPAVTVPDQMLQDVNSVSAVRG
ncbi:hypothetical protein DM52_2798 [Burkholderia mallei]|nr:hypothetical protein DM52_2798 [Burkholderia mallei]